MIENSSKHYNYKAYSFHISSTFEIPEFLNCESECSDRIAIQYANISDIVDDPVYATDTIQVYSNLILIDIDQVARYKIGNGNCIDIQPYDGVTEREIRLYLIASAFEAIIFQRGIFPLHGSAIIHKKHAFIFSGISGCGKSTLAAWFIQKGYSILADDVCIITLDDSNRAIVHPGYPLIKLWTDSLLKLGNTFQRYNSERNTIMKHSIPLDHDFCSEPAVLRGIYFMDIQASYDICLMKPGAKEIELLVDLNIYRLNLFQKSLESPTYTRYKKVLGKTPIIRKVIRPDNENTMENLFLCIEKDILNYKKVWL